MIPSPFIFWFLHKIRYSQE